MNLISEFFPVGSPGYLEKDIPILEKSRMTKFLFFTNVQEKVQSSCGVSSAEFMQSKIPGEPTRKIDQSDSLLPTKVLVCETHRQNSILFQKLAE